jgi:endo-alpha-1,4-polygalactosaminidase (GH114 family)
MRKKAWGKFLIEELIPSTLQKGFQGIFLDTLDNPVYLEEREPEKFKGMKQAAINIVKAIRFHFPDIIIMVNRAYGLIPDIAPDIDMLLAESLYTDYNFDKKNYFKVPDNEYHDQLRQLTNFKNKWPHLQLFSLDYWEISDQEGIKKIYQQERSVGLIPYVADIKLDKIIREATPEL